MTRLDWFYIAQLTGLPFHPGPRAHTDQDSIFGNLEPIVVAGRALAAGLAATAFYARFRLPFALLVIAGSVVLFVSMIFRSILSSGSMTGMLILLGCGLGVFAVAMAYDLSDRTRTTRNADCAFWLHLLAAPLIVHSLIRLIVPASDDNPGWLNMTTTSAIAIYAIVALLTAIAVLIDRRALLVSALSYLGIAIGYALTGAVRAGADRREVVVFFATLLILGALVLVLGVAWQPLRRIFLRPFPSALVERLPPAMYPA
jgi:hypothetical protein